MKGYLIFGGKCFYARGGFNDLIGNEDTITESVMHVGKVRAEAAAKFADDIEWFQIVHAATGRVVFKSEDNPLGAEEHNAAPHHLKFVDGALVTQRVREAWEDE